MVDYKEIAGLLRGLSETPETDARFFCEYYQNNPTQEQIADFIRRRKNQEPVAKIIGQKGFWKRDFYVSSAVLDPRPDTETLIEAVLAVFSVKDKPFRLLDVGTGSGCLALSLIDEYPLMQAIGVDKSLKALEVAQKNDPTKKVSWLQKDFFSVDFEERLGLFDIIVSNPPYIPTDEIAFLEKSVSFDPLLALDGGADGLDAYRALAKKLFVLLKDTGVVFFEIGQGQAQDVKAIMSCQNWVLLKEYKDLNGIVRVLSFQKRNAAVI